MPKPYVSARDRAVIVERARERCEYCQSPLEFFIDPYVVEHVIPKSHGGDNKLTNLALSCQGCNSHKYDKTSAIDPVTEVSVLLYHLRQDKWQDHFAWNDEFTLMIGLTPKGRATIVQLQLNRPGVVNLRRVLFVMGIYPTDATLKTE